MKPLIKVCGMKYLENTQEVVKLLPDFMGFIFYEKSQRSIEELSVHLLLEILVPSIKIVGVFVNATKRQILFNKNKFNYVQLHGDESPQYCSVINNEGVKIIKAFGMDDDFDFDKLKNYLPYCEYFLFDTKTAAYGGSGKKYNWQKLKEYKLDIPFFLSGGISVEDAEAIKALGHPQLYAVDINSKFEIQPGLKNVELVETFIKEIRL